MPGANSSSSTVARLGRSDVSRTVKAFLADKMTDTAAALTYFAILSIFPGLLVMASLLGMLGRPVTEPLLGKLTTTAPDPVRHILSGSLQQLTAAPGLAGVMAVVGLAGAVWAASAYVAAFMRASNVIYDVTEKRPLWKQLGIRLAVTVAVGVLLVVAALLVVFTGRLATSAGAAVGASSAAVTVWGIVKWPVLLLVVAAVLTILFWACPSTHVGGVTGLAPGGLLAVALWVVASAGFAVYVANFASYDRTYGALGGVIVFLVWLWVSNLAILFGAEFNAVRRRRYDDDA